MPSQTGTAQSLPHIFLLRAPARLLGFLNGIATASALEGLSHVVQALRRPGVRFPEPEALCLELGPDHPLSLNYPVNTRLLKPLDRFLRGSERLTEGQLEHGDPLLPHTFLRQGPLLDRVITLCHCSV